MKVYMVFDTPYFGAPVFCRKVHSTFEKANAQKEQLDQEAEMLGIGVTYVVKEFEVDEE